MNFAFQDREKLYLVMDLMKGGDLRFNMIKNRRFTENQCSKTFLIKFKFILINNFYFNCIN